MVRRIIYLESYPFTMNIVKSGVKRHNPNLNFYNGAVSTGYHSIENNVIFT